MSDPPAEPLARSSAHGLGHDFGSMYTVVGQPVERPLDLFRLEMHEIVDRSQRDELADGAARGDGGAAAVRLKAGLRDPPGEHAQKDPCQIAAARVLPLASRV